MRTITVILVIINILTSGFALYNGQQISNEERYMYVVAILSKIPSPFPTGLIVFRYECVGTAISNTHILTAGHCLENYWDLAITESQYLDVYYVQYGLPQINLKSMENTVSIGVKDVYFHPEFRTEQCTINDMAVIKLNVDFRLPVIKICGHGEFNNDVEGSVISWKDHSSPAKRGLHHLIFAKFTILDMKSCALFNTNETIIHENYHICAIGTNGSHTGGGDSGGPLIITTSEKSCQSAYVFCGLQRSSSKTPSAFIRVLAFSSWMKNYVDNLFEDPQQESTTSEISVTEPDHTLKETTTKSDTNHTFTDMALPENFEIILFSSLLIVVLLLLLLVVVVVLSAILMNKIKNHTRRQSISDYRDLTFSELVLKIKNEDESNL